MVRGGVSAALAVLIGLAAPPDARSCEARVELDPPKAWTGQQVLHEIVIRGVDERATIEWIHPPSFPDVRAMPLPPAPTTAVDPPDTRRQRRALHPARAGRLTLPATPYRCRPSGDAVSIEARTPEVVLDVEDPPREGRPATWRGLVGRPRLLVQASPTRVRVGETARVVATLTGPGLMRRAGLTWPSAALEASEVAPELFASPPRHRAQLGLQHGTRRVETLEIVPHATGELWIPAIEVAYFDPDAGTYGVVASDAVAIEVLAEAPPGALGEATGARAASRDGPGGARGRAAWMIATGAGIGLVVWAWVRRSRR